MRTPTIPLGPCLLVACLLAASWAGADEAPAPAGGEIVMAYKPARTFGYDLPGERWLRVGPAFDFGHAGGARFATALEGTALRVDTDADGQTDVKVEGKDGFVRLRTKEGFDYALRLRHDAGGWSYAAAGARVGKIGATRLTLIDRDGDGRYDGFGQDALIVGLSKSACLLSRVINVEGALHRIEVAADGTRLTHAPYTGAAGRLDLARHWAAQARLQSAVVLSEDRSLSFDLARHPQGLRVPTGRYLLHSGKLGLGENVVRFRTGRSKAIDVGPDGRVAVKGGGPLQAEFGYRRNGSELVFAPDALHWYGRAGEEYYSWKPFGKSPEFTVSDAKVRREIAKAIFTGC